MEKGKVVYLKSGSPAMTVGLDTSHGLRCQWFVGSELKEGYFIQEQLTETKLENLEKDPKVTRRVPDITIVPKTPNKQ